MKLSIVTLVVSAFSLVNASNPREKFARLRGRSISESFKNSSIPSCPVKEVDLIEAPKTNIWADLNESETQDVFNLMFENFNLTLYEDATAYDNYLMWIETLRPNKTDALSYLDHDGKAPEKYARVVIFFGAEEYTSEEYPDGYWENFQVGPLPLSNKTTIEPLDYIYTKSKIAYNVGYRDDFHWSTETEFYTRIFTSDVMLPVLLDLVGDGIQYFGTDNTSVDAWGTDPLNYDAETGLLSNWVTIFYDENEAEDILPTGIFFQANITGRDPSQYSVLQWVYNNIAYNSSEAFREAWESPDFEKLPMVDYTNLTWTLVGNNGEDAREFDDKVAPIVIEPQGRRWTYDENERYFTWMDWEFYIAWSRDLGLTLYDVKFKGERILYEVGLQEAIAEYAGDDPFQTYTCYLDRTYGFGNEAYGLIPGYDCPENAVYLNTTWHSYGANNYQNNSYCVFESVEDYPISRHTASTYISVSKNPTFNVRSVTTIGNYDYNFSYKFYLDGTIEIICRAAGYIQGAYYNPATADPFGYRLHDVLSGSFHDHVLNFKADFDIGGTSNRVTNTALKAAQVEYPWAPGVLWDTKIREREIIETEDDATIDWPANGAGVLLVESADQNNTWGNPRAYRIIPESSNVHRISNNSIIVGDNAYFANHDIFFTKHKDSEPSSSSAFNGEDVFDPATNFRKFFDGESLDGEDVVCWFNLGLHHLPNTQDVPNTIFSTAKTSVVFTPYNYFDSEQSRDTLQQMIYTYEDNSWDFNDATVESSCEYVVEPLNYDMFNYDGLEISKGTTNDPSP